MLRVAFVTGNYNYAVDGVALTSNRQVEYLLDHGDAVRVYSPTATPAFPHAGDLVSVPSVPFFAPYRLAVGVTPGVRRDLIAFRPNLVHIATPDLLGIAAFNWARRRGVPVVTTYHTHFASYLTYYRLGVLGPACWWAQRWFYPACAAVYVAGASMADELRSHGVAANFVTAPLGVDAANFTPAKRSAEWRARHGLRPETVAVLFVGRLVWEKGLGVFARVVAKLEADGLPVRAVVVGEGPAGPGLRKLLPGAVFTGRLGGEELATAYASSDVFFFPSASETFGCVTVEALASGLPCVVADATGSKDIIRDGVEGFVRPPADEAGFADVLRRLVRDTTLRRTLSAAAVTRAAAFGWDRMLAGMRANFESQTGEPSP